MPTTRTDFCATANRIPRRIRPFDLRLVAHALLQVIRPNIQHARSRQAGIRVEAAGHI